MKASSWIIILAMIGGAIADHLLKKYSMVNFPTITLASLLKIETWIQLMTTPAILFTLVLGYAFWALSLLLVQAEGLNKMLLVTTATTPIILITTIYLSGVLFQETLTSRQTFGFIILLVSMILSVVSAYYTGGGIQ